MNLHSVDLTHEVLYSKTAAEAAVTVTITTITVIVCTMSFLYALSQPHIFNTLNFSTINHSNANVRHAACLMCGGRVFSISLSLSSLSNPTRSLAQNKSNAFFNVSNHILQ